MNIKEENLAKLKEAYESRSTYVEGYPAVLMLESIAVCNLKCAFCGVGQGKVERERKLLDLETYKRLMEEIGPYLFKIRLFGMGEPLLDKNIFDMIEIANSYDIYTIVSTNGTYLNEQRQQRLIDSELDELIISLDGASPETHTRYRVGSDFDEVVENTRAFMGRKGKQKPHTILQNVVNAHNEHEIMEFSDLGRRLGVDEISFKTLSLMGMEATSKFLQFLPDNGEYSRYNVDNSDVTHKSPTNNCEIIWYETAITSDGEVTPCCYDFNAQFSFGNVRETTFRQIWNNEKYQKFRKSLLEAKSTIPMCRACTGNWSSLEAK